MKSKKIWLVIGLIVIVLMASSLINNMKNTINNYRPSITTREYYKYSEDIKYTYYKVDNSSILRYYELIIPIYKNESCTIKTYICDYFYFDDFKHYISTSDNGSDWTALGIIDSSLPLPTYDFVNEDRYSYFKFCDILFRIDWGTHFELLADIGSYLYSSVDGNYDSGEYEIEKDTPLVYTYFGFANLNSISWNNFLSYKSLSYWYNITQIVGSFFGEIIRDYLKFDINLDCYIRSFSSGGSDIDTGGEGGGVSGGGFGGGGGGRW